VSSRYRFADSMTPGGVETIVALLQDHAAVHPERRFATFHEGAPLSYGALHRGALQVGGVLQARGLAPGARVVLLFPTCPELILAFFGVLYAGGVPVPMYPPPSLGALKGYLLRQRRLVEDARADVLICDGRLGFVAQKLAAGLKRDLILLPWDRVEDEASTELAIPALGPRDTALIQYTSGSTGRPKGVVVSHGALLANLEAAGRPMGYRPDDRMNHWLPLYHDMGLIGMMLLPLAFAVPVWMMGPQDFLREPLLWLRSVSDGRATITVAPNFAYGYLLRRLGDQPLPDGLDLSCVRVCYHGAEPISADLMDRFAARMAPVGFDPDCFMPVYGLAETSLIATCPDPDAPPTTHRVDRERLDREGLAVLAGPTTATTRRLVGVGRAVIGTELMVVDDQGQPLPDHQQGHVVLRGASLSDGYFRNPTATDEAFVDGWLQTGDLGYLADGELFVTGRSKDVIIAEGRKFHPQDLEEAAGEVLDVRAGCAVAFGVHDIDQADTLVVIVVESREDDPARMRAIAADVSTRVTRHTGCRVGHVAVVAPKTVPKTSSGKLQRRPCQRGFVAQALGVPLDEVPPDGSADLAALRAALGKG